MCQLEPETKLFTHHRITPIPALTEVGIFGSLSLTVPSDGWIMLSVAPAATFILRKLHSGTLVNRPLAWFIFSFFSPNAAASALLATLHRQPLPPVPFSLPRLSRLNQRLPKTQLPEADPTSGKY
jgi:hypothetical protein